MTLQGLLDVATVIDGDGDWTKSQGGYEFRELACGRTHGTADICAAPPIEVTNESAVTIFKAVPFVHHAEQEFNIQCEPAEAVSALTQAMKDAAEYVVTRQFWSGDASDWTGTGEGIFLTAPGIATAAAGADVPASIAAALAGAYAAQPDLRPVVHLGLGASFALPPGFTDDHPSVTYVEGIGYPADGIAVSGPITVHLGTVETIAMTSTDINRRYISGTRLLAVEFGPCSAVRVA
jgi:hypothetical protein